MNEVIKEILVVATSNSWTLPAIIGFPYFAVLMVGGERIVRAWRNKGGKEDE